MTITTKLMKLKCNGLTRFYLGHFMNLALVILLVFPEVFHPFFAHSVAICAKSEDDDLEYDSFIGLGL